MEPLCLRCTHVGRFSTDVIPGTLDMLILKTLSLTPCTGNGIARRIEGVSQLASALRVRYQFRYTAAE